MKNTVRSIRGLAFAGVASLGLIAMTPALADSDFDFDNGNAALSASADLDFEIVIPRFLYLQVGAPTGVDTVSFDLSTGVTDLASAQANLGSGTPVTSTDTVAVRLIGNVGDVNVAATSTTGGLVRNGGAPTDIIPWSEISGTAANGTASNGLDAMVAGDSDTVGATNGIVDASDTWTFSFANSTLYQGGTYEGTVTYTATSL